MATYHIVVDHVVVNKPPPDDTPACVDGVWEIPKKKKTLKSPIIDINNTDKPLLDPNSTDSTDTSTDEPTKTGKKTEKRALCVSILTLLISIPALIGAWCWPALVIGLVGGTVTSSARSLGHYVSFGVTLAMLIMMSLYTLYTVKRRTLPNWNKYGPLYLTLISVPLIMADLLRHVLQDVGSWPSPGSSEYRPGCESENVTCLSVVGVFFTIIMTYLGFAFLVVGSLWNANICEKLREIRIKWREIRTGESTDS